MPGQAFLHPPSNPPTQNSQQQPLAARSPKVTGTKSGREREPCCHAEVKPINPGDQCQGRHAPQPRTNQDRPLALHSTPYVIDGKDGVGFGPVARPSIKNKLNFDEPPDFIWFDHQLLVISRPSATAARVTSHIPFHRAQLFLCSPLPLCSPGGVPCAVCRGHSDHRAPNAATDCSAGRRAGEEERSRRGEEECDRQMRHRLREQLER
ncbi:unnamed protein product [Pleuronectes platessa]|uniref:Uncharacterized protein n=1 Tax=Pleuronectes platessa TaxID=8262 RepID=A0A9N7YB89_PLEPL|nr:unnamed protein product [Pleuronectes platessa]